jgi:hypothetical protein
MSRWQRVKHELRKRTNTIFLQRTSSAVAHVLIYVLASNYVVHAISRPAGEVYPLGMTAFGITAAFAAICFSVPETVPGSAAFRYSAEKFLHSSVLLIQTVMIIYLKDSVEHSQWAAAYQWAAKPLHFVLKLILPLISGAAAITWSHGFEAVDRQLWANWEHRLEQLQKLDTTRDDVNGRGPSQLASSPQDPHSEDGRNASV